MVSSTGAWAACSFSGGTVYREYTVTIPSITIPRNAAIGTSLGTAQTAAIPATSVFASCTAPGTVSRTVTGTTQITGDPNFTYATDVPGVGIRYYDGNTSGYRRYWGKGPSESWAGTWSWGSSFLGAELVVTGPVGTGVVNEIPTATFSLDGLRVATIRLLSGTAITGRTCSITSTTTNVTLPTVRVSDFSQVGATAGEKAFSLNLDCSMAGTANAFITFTDNAQPGNTGNRLTLSPGSSSKGVQLQLYRNGVPISFGPDAAAMGTTNQISLGAATSLSQIPLTVRYIRTGDVAPGSVSAVATFTLSYQ